jgi:paired amphipathic helix protein Sin3a
VPIALTSPQVQSILGDNKCQTLWGLLQRARAQPTHTNLDIIRYRRLAQENANTASVGDQVYRLQWVGVSRGPSLRSSR